MSSITTTPRKALSTRSHRPTYNYTASTPNLAAATYTANSPNTAYDLKASRGNRSPRKLSLSSLTQSSLASIPDASESYGMSVAHYNSPSQNRTFPLNMGRLSGMDDGGQIEVGDLVDVPGSMHGMVKFVGNVNGKKGVFAGVELSEEFASRGKNNGDVDGISYFVTSIDGAGIFLPLNRATKRNSPPPSPTTPRPTYGRAHTSHKVTPPTPIDFSKSVGPARSATTGGRQLRRPSLPRPESPVRRLNSTTPRPSVGGTPSVRSSNSRYAPSPTPQKFSQSVRGTRDVGDPAKKSGYTPRPRATPRSSSALSHNDFDDDNNTTPLGASRFKKASISSASSFARPGIESRASSGEVSRLKLELEERERQLKEQATSLAEMEHSLSELQELMAEESGGRDSYGGKDAHQLRFALREKNEKIAMLTSEFDAHRADFRSTIDTLEMASTETERVYEQRVEDLLRELQDYQDRSDDVDSVAIQLKQLEELVQELEEGLEDARRGEAEARGEVEFLRGEVERGRSELKREREKAAANQTHGGDDQGLLAQRDDEIRGLKAIIHSISRDGNQGGDLQRTPTNRSGNFEPTPRSSQELKEKVDKQKLERELVELRLVVESKNQREEKLERELETLRRMGISPAVNGQRTSTTSSLTIQDHSSHPTNDSWRDRDLASSRTGGAAHSRTAAAARQKPTRSTQESVSQSATTENSSLWCEICETGGHDILTCTNMFGSKQSGQPHSRHQAHVNTTGSGHSQHVPSHVSKPSNPEFAPAALQTSRGVQQVKEKPDFNGTDPVAGKESGVVNPDRWCALCERDGHESVDCPFDDML